MPILNLQMESFFSVIKRFSNKEDCNACCRCNNTNIAVAPQPLDAVVRARLDDHDRRLVLLSVIQVPAHRMQQQQQQQQQ